MIKKLRIELALARHKNERASKYRVLQAESEVEKYLDLPYTINKDSFIANLSTVSVEKKKLLCIVENKISKLLDKTPDLFQKYNALLSYLYFTFMDEQESNIFSSPHITSPILFNPSDSTATYTLHTEHQSSINYDFRVNMYKRVNPIVVAYNMALIRPNAPHTNTAKYPDKQKIINSLFDYYTKDRTDSNVTSCYKDIDSVVSGINVISDYEMKRFIYLSEPAGSNPNFLTH